MSYTINHSLREWKAVEAKLRSTKVLHSGHRLSEADTERIANAYVLWALVIQDLVPYFGDLYRQYSFSALSRWLQVLIRTDVVDVQSTTKCALAKLRQYSTAMGEGGPGSFKRFLQQDSLLDLEFMKIFIPMFNRYSGNAEQYFALNTILQFTSRLTLNDVDWILEENIQTYVDFEGKLKEQTYPTEILCGLRQISDQDGYFRSDFDFWPSHSGGATADLPFKGKGSAAKWRRMKSDLRGEQLMRYYGYDNPLLSMCPHMANQPCVVTFAPKGVDKKRVISMEPIFHQYLQHGVFRNMETWFRNHPEFNIHLDDQERNRSLALIGSVNCRFGTIDLSNASDSVTNTLVLSALNQILVGDLVRCRSREAILPNGSKLRLEKFAPMGSAVCFPLECYVFSLICRLACKRLGVNGIFSVYGDDIICEDIIFDEVVRLLTSLNFEVNQDKTFHPYGFFKESCGIEAYMGKDVSPCRLPRFYDVKAVRRGAPGSLAGLESLANRLETFQLRSARRYVVSLALEVYKYPYFSYNGDEGFFSNTPTNYHLRRRWNRRYQRPECLAIESKSITSKGPDCIRYIECLERLSHTKREKLLLPDNRVEVSSGPSRTQLRSCWRSDQGASAPYRPTS